MRLSREQFMSEMLSSCRLRGSQVLTTGLLLDSVGRNFGRLPVNWDEN